MSKRGFALVGALIAVVLLGALIVGAFVATTEEARISGNVRLGAMALYGAESSIENDLSGWAQGQADSLMIGQTVSRVTASGDLSVKTSLVKLDSTLFWLIAEATEAPQNASASAGIRRRISLLVRRGSDSTGKTVLFRVGERPWSELF